MIGLLTIGAIALLALRKKRGVSGIGTLSRFEWNIYRDLINQIEEEIMNFIESNDFDRYFDDDVAPLVNPRLDISISPDSRTGYDFEVIIDEAQYFQYPEKTYDLEPLITEHEDGYLTIDYEELENVVMDFLDRKIGRNVAGIGELAKRRFFREISYLQPKVDFELPYSAQSEEAKKLIDKNCDSINKMYPRRKLISPEKYFNQLKRQYNAVSGIGATTLKATMHTVFNKLGDRVIQYYDYGTPQEQLQDAIKYMISTYAANDPFSIGYYGALAYIAHGGKLIWDSKNNSKNGVRSIFTSNSSGERKARISYLGKAGISIDALAHKIWEDADGYARGIDDYYITDGVIEAIRTCTSKQQAINTIMDKYIEDHTIEDFDKEEFDYYASSATEEYPTIQSDDIDDNQPF